MAEVQGPVEPDAPEPLAEPAEGADAPVKEKVKLPKHSRAPSVAVCLLHVPALPHDSGRLVSRLSKSCCHRT